MHTALLLLAASVVIEFIFTFALHGIVRRIAATITIMLVSFSSGAILFLRPNIATAALLIFSAYRVINLLRLAEARMHETRLRRVTRATGLWLIGLQAFVLIVWYMQRRFSWHGNTWLWLLVSLQLATALILLASTRRHLRTTALVAAKLHEADRDLPAVSVAIPARNEDDQLEACLQTILASDYPKLEVLVLDDCSQDRTPEIIRGFAHDGVRFIPGEVPRDGWLAKNQAYHKLAQESSGELIIFCGVDVRFAAGTVRQMVGTLEQKRKIMLSIAPLNMRPGLSLPQSMRYVWELSLPRRMFNRPPILSSCWLIKASELKRLGGFEAVSNSISPEAYFAREAIKHDGYSFLRSSEALGLTSAKTLPEQRATAVRTRYPQLHRRPELAALLSTIELGLLVGPFVLAVLNIWVSFGFLGQAAQVVTIVLLLVTYGSVCRAMFPRNKWMAGIMLPVAVLGDVALLNYSMWQYEFEEVVWKGRNVCAPVMRAIPHLPKM